MLRRSVRTMRALAQAGATAIIFVMTLSCASDDNRALGPVSDMIICRPVDENYNPDTDPPACWDDGTGDDGSGAPTDPSPGAPGIWVPGWSAYTCSQGWDPDVDGMNNACENALAEAFAPLMVVMPGDCSWDATLNREGGEYFFVAQPRNASTVRLAYLPAYYWDCGSSGFSIFATDAGKHTGDSEFILLDVTFDNSTGHWVTDSVFLSAHCDELFKLVVIVTPIALDSDCHWFGQSAFAWRDSRPYGAPIVWVSEMKHGNYASQGECNTNNTILQLDDCSYNTSGYVFPVVFEQQNAGSRNYQMPEDCPHPISGSPMANPAIQECLWNPDPTAPFNGWQSVILTSPTYNSYGWHLQLYGDFF